jgi:hypothetical protein
LLNPVTGRQVFALGGPLFRTRARAPLDLMARTTITGLLYARWREEGTSPLPFAELLAKVSGFPEKRVRAEIDYLAAQGLVDLPSENSVRLSVSGIDRWEQHILGGAPS